MSAHSQHAPEFARSMGAVAREVLGEPSHQTKRELRYGTHGSLSIDLEKGTFFDHEANEGGGVLLFLQKKAGLEKDDALAWMRERKHLEPAISTGNFTIAATYTYTDEDGVLLYEVCRMVPKDFRQRRPDPDKPGKWLWKLGDTRRVLYHLPDVIDAVQAGRIIYICEGEKGVDALRGLGLDATCSPGGANNWRRELGSALNGAHVVILPDNDEPGQKHAEEVSKALQTIHARAASVRIVSLPNLGHKEDVWDWVAAGGTAEQLAALAQQSETAPEPPQQTRVVDPSKLHGLVIPPRRWIVQDWLPYGHVTLNYGDGGTGKTLLAQQLMTSCATGLPWCGLEAQRCRVFGFFCEDDGDELHRRQVAICEAYGISLADLGDMRWISGVGEDNLLVTFDKEGRVQLTDRYYEILKAAKDFGAKFIVIDTAADTFGGNENDRSQVRQYIGHALNKLAAAIDGAVLLNAHPSRSGMSATGDMDGGSTGWSNSARSRWSLARPKEEDGQPADTDERILTRRKANYSSIGQDLKLRWTDGVLVAKPQAGRGSFMGMSNPLLTQGDCERVFLELLARCDALNMPVHESKRASNWAPKVFAKRPDAAGYTLRQFDTAMSSLFAHDMIKLENYGRSGDQRRRIVVVPETTEEAPE
jgi:AAA domain